MRYKEIYSAAAGLAAGAIIGIGIAYFFPVEQKSIDQRVQETIQSTNTNKSDDPKKDMKEFLDAFCDLRDAAEDIARYYQEKGD